MTRRAQLWVGLGLVFSVAACDDLGSPSQPVTPTNDVLLSSEVRTAEQSLKVVARGVAVAMQEQAVRVSVRDALRDSPWDVHQVSLQGFMRSDGGAALLAGAAAAAGETPEAFLARLEALPDLDFYMPSRVHRRTWRATPGVIVAAGIDVESGSVYGFGPAGQAVGNVRGDGAGNQPVLMINPAEPRGARANAQPAGVGDVIQAAADGENAVRYTWTDEHGRTTVVEAPAEGGFTTQSYGDSTYIDYAFFETNDSGSDLELTFYAKFYRPDGTYMGEWTYTNYSFPYRVQWYGHQPLLLPVLPDSSNAYIELRVREDDGWGNPDEHYGPRTYTWVDRGQIRRLNVSGNSSIYADIELDWVRRAAPVLTSVYVAPVTVNSGYSGSTYAEARDQYGWKMLNQSVSSWSSANTSIATVSGSGSTGASVSGISSGVTSASATISGVTGSGGITVENYWQNCDPNLDPMCPQ